MGDQQTDRTYHGWRPTRSGHMSSRTRRCRRRPTTRTSHGRTALSGGFCSRTSTNRSCIGPAYSCARQCVNGFTPGPHDAKAIHTPSRTQHRDGGHRDDSINCWTSNSGQLHAADTVTGPWVGIRGSHTMGGWYNADGSAIRACEGPGHCQPGVDIATRTAILGHIQPHGTT